MAANWGVIEQVDEGGTFVAFHIVPMVNIDGDVVMSSAHDLNPECQCHPSLSQNDHGYDMLNHHDADHPGSIEGGTELKSDEEEVKAN